MTAHQSDCLKCRHAQLNNSGTLRKGYFQQELLIYCNKRKHMVIHIYEKCNEQEKRHTWID